MRTRATGNGARRRLPLEAGFTPEEVERARRYHRPLYVAMAVDLSLSLGVLAALSFSPAGDLAHALVGGAPWWAEASALTAIVVALSFAVRLPLSFWRGFVRERRWGFSTQTVAGWAADRAKGLAVSAVLGAVAVTGFVALARAAPRAWPLVAVPAGAGLVVLLSFVAPVVLEPVFNRFTPLPDEELAADLRSLSERAGVPVRGVLVADASRRTRKQNAYVSGLGRTRRVVLYDTLLARADPRQVRIVVAHELGHRRMRHVLLGTALGAGGLAAGVAVLGILLGSPKVLASIGAVSAGDPRVAPFVLLVAGLLEVGALPLQAAISRRWELAADRFSLDLTADPHAFEAAHRDLARANLSDLDPPRAIYLAAFTHPTAPERIRMARACGHERRSG